MGISLIKETLTILQECIPNILQEKGYNVDAVTKIFDKYVFGNKLERDPSSLHLNEKNIAHIKQLHASYSAEQILPEFKVWMKDQVTFTIQVIANVLKGMPKNESAQLGKVDHVEHKNVQLVKIPKVYPPKYSLKFMICSYPCYNYQIRSTFGWLIKEVSKLDKPIWQVIGESFYKNIPNDSHLPLFFMINIYEKKLELLFSHLDLFGVSLDDVLNYLEINEGKVEQIKALRESLDDNINNDNALKLE